MDKIFLDYSKETNLENMVETHNMDEASKNDLLEKLKAAESKEVLRQEDLYQKQVLQEYIASSEILAFSPFFRTATLFEFDKADLHVVFSFPADSDSKNHVELQLSLRMPCRSKPLHIPSLKQFMEALHYEEPIFIGGKKYIFSFKSFEPIQRDVLKILMDHFRFIENSQSEKSLRSGFLDLEVFGIIAAKMAEHAAEQLRLTGYIRQEDDFPLLSGLYEGSLDQGTRYSSVPVNIRFMLEYIPPPTSKILVNPALVIDGDMVALEEVRFFACAKPCMLYKGVFYRFREQITRLHLKHLRQVRDITIPEPLFFAFF